MLTLMWTPALPKARHCLQGRASSPASTCCPLPCHDAVMTSSDVAAILARIDQLAIQPSIGSRGWSHMGAVLADASLQAGIRYNSTVLPRVKRLLAAWPDARTTSGLVERMRSEDVATVLNWQSESKKMNTLRDLVAILAAEGIETTSDLRQSLENDRFRRQLKAVKGVGPKTIDYLAILTGSSQDVAVDTQLRAFVRDAGAAASTYEDVRGVVTEAAAARGWSPSALDAAIWAYQTSRKR